MLYLKGMRIMMFQLSGFYYRDCRRLHVVLCILWPNFVSRLQARLLWLVREVARNPITAPCRHKDEALSTNHKQSAFLYSLPTRKHRLF